MPSIIIMSSEDVQRLSGPTSLMPDQTSPSPRLMAPVPDTPAPMESEDSDDLMLRYGTLFIFCETELDN